MEGKAWAHLFKLDSNFTPSIIVDTKGRKILRTGKAFGRIDSLLGLGEPSVDFGNDTVPEQYRPLLLLGWGLRSLVSKVKMGEEAQLTGPISGAPSSAARLALAAAIAVRPRVVEEVEAIRRS